MQDAERRSLSHNKSGKPWKEILSILAVYFGGLLSVAQIVGASFWTGLFLMGIGIAWFLYRFWTRRPTRSTPTQPNAQNPATTIKTLVDSEHSELNEPASTVLSFYGSEATSHANVLVGFVIAFFTLLQIPRITSNIKGTVGFEGIVYLVILGGTYFGMRIVYYGTMSTGITGGFLRGGEGMETFASLWWGDPSKRIPQTFLHQYCTWRLRKLRIRGILFKRPLITFMASIIVSAGVWLALTSILF